MTASKTVQAFKRRPQRRESMHDNISGDVMKAAIPSADMVLVPALRESDQAMFRP